MTSIFSPNQTSAKLLVDFAAQAWLSTESGTNPELQKRYLVVYDLYIKARSYTIINKLAFWFALCAGIMVLVWPSVTIVSKDLGFDSELLKSAIVQTTITGLAAFTFGVYSHYKKRQLHTENLMRQVVYSDEPNQQLVDRIVKEMERIDTGFVFSESASEKEDDGTGKKPG